MKKFLIIAAVIIIVVVGFILIRNNQNATEMQETINSLQTEAARIDSLTATIGETGTVRSNQTAHLSWGSSGNVGNILVEVGQQVQKGDILAELDETSVPQNVILAKVDILSAEKALEALYDSFDDSAIAIAYERVQEAWKTLEYAEDNLWNLLQPSKQANIDRAEANLVLANERVEKAQQDYDRWENSGNEVLVASMKAALAEAQLAQDSAENTLYVYTHGPSEYTIANYEADLEVARTNYESVQENYDEILLGANNKEIEAAEARVTAAEITLDQMYIRAPFDGTITDIDILVGDDVNVGTMAFRIDDFSHYLVDVNISEIDINRIHAGQDVSLTFDAINDALYEGSVLEVGQVGFEAQGVVFFEITIELLNPNELIKPGMTSGAYITVDKLDDVLIVSNRAVRVENGDRIVYILEGDEILMKVVVLGASADTYSEVVSGELEVGDLVILNPPTSIFNFSEGGMSGFRGMGQ